MPSTAAAAGLIFALAGVVKGQVVGTPVIEEYASAAVSPMVLGTAVTPVAGKTTYRLRYRLDPAQSKSVYAMYGDARSLPHVPQAYFNSYAANAISAPDSSFFMMMPAMFNDLMLTSFLALGPDDSEHAPNTGTVGTAIDAWAAGGALTLGVNPGPTDDFSMFWMDPNDSAEQVYPAGGPLIAQLTLNTGEPFYVKLGLQGKSFGEHTPDWHNDAVEWVFVDPTTRACPRGFSGADCTTDINECDSNPCVNADRCWNGLDQYACICADGVTVDNFCDPTVHGTASGGH
jgi:hypothetical protein